MPSKTSRTLKNKIHNKNVKIFVIGLGYVGLPLAVSFAKKGFTVVGIDKNKERVDRIHNKKSYISDVKTKNLKACIKKGTFRATADFKELSEADIILICVPTPLKRKYTPDISFILSAVRKIRKYHKKGALIVLESTTYPGTTKEMILPILSKGGRKIDRDFYLSFSPERIDPGNKDFGITKIPKVVGGVTLKSGQLTQSLYKKIIKNVYPVSSAKAAEMTKLLENSFRIINIGWINEVARMCNSMDINVWEVIEAAKTKPFGFLPFYPGLGVGGHCIPDDPLYLYWKARHHGFYSKYLKLSADTNDHMVDYAVSRIKDILKKRRKTLTKSKILVVGVTYKKDVKDLRKSPPLKLIEALKKENCSVDYYDPIIPYLDLGGIDQMSIKLTKPKIASYDCVLMTTDHSRVRYKLILDNAKAIFDIRNVYKDSKHKKVTRF